MTDGRPELEQSQTHEPEEMRPRRSRRRRRRWYQKLPPWVREYWVEIAMVTAVLLAIFLLVEPWDIREGLFALVRRAMAGLSDAIGGLGTAVGNWVSRLSLSDATALVILLGVVLVAGWRARWRILRTRRFWNTQCPSCDSADLKRVPRRAADRLVGRLGFPVRRYRCSACNWEGRRIYSKQITGHAAAKLPAPD